MDIQFYVKYYRGDIFQVWCSELCGASIAHGERLVYLLGTPTIDGRPGMTDNVRAAEKFLEIAHSIGWIIRGSLCPTPSQQFFGIGGRSGSHKYIEYRSTVEYMWAPNRSFRTLIDFVATGKVGKIRSLSKRTIQRIENNYMGKQ